MTEPVKLAAMFEVKVVCQACKGTGRGANGWACGKCPHENGFAMGEGRRAVPVGNGRRTLFVDALELWWLQAGGYVEQDPENVDRVRVCPPKSSRGPAYSMLKESDIVRTEATEAAGKAWEHAYGPHWRRFGELPPPREGGT